MNRPALFTAARMRSSCALIIAAGATTAALAQQPAPQEHDHSAAAPSVAQGCAMMAQHKNMMAMMAADDQKLADLVARMNAATGDAKVEAIAAVVSEIAAQRARMTKMQGDAMGHLKSHGSPTQGHPPERRAP
jgi:ABC-type glycerol-3-phosphate transport system substrate-binding protein